MERLFEFESADAAPADLLLSLKSATPGSDLLAGAETVEEAHETLVDADSDNAERFASVIKFAKADVERLKKR